MGMNGVQAGIPTPQVAKTWLTLIKETAAQSESSQVLEGAEQYDKKNKVWR